MFEFSIFWVVKKEFLVNLWVDGLIGFFYFMVFDYRFYIEILVLVLVRLFLI